MRTLGRSELDEKAGAGRAWDRKGASRGWTGRWAQICARKWLSQVWKLDAGARVRGWMRRRALGVLGTGRALPVASGGRAFCGGRSFNNYPKNNYFRHLIRVKHLDYSG